MLIGTMYYDKNGNRKVILEDKYFNEICKRDNMKYHLEKSDKFIKRDDGAAIRLMQIVCDHEFEIEISNEAVEESEHLSRNGEVSTLTIRKGDKGGYVEDFYNLDENDTSWISKNAIVAGYSRISGDNTYITGNVIIDGNSIVTGGSVIFGNAKIKNSIITGYNSIGDDALVTNAIINGNNIVLGNAHVSGNLIGTTLVGDYAIVEKNTTVCSSDMDDDNGMVLFENAVVKEGSVVVGDLCIGGKTEICNSYKYYG